MRGGTGRLPGRDDARDLGMHIMFLQFSSHIVYMEAGRFSSRTAWAGSRFQQPRSRLEQDDFCHINSSSRLARDDIVLTLHYLQKVTCKVSSRWRPTIKDPHLMWQVLTKI